MELMQNIKNFNLISRKSLDDSFDKFEDLPTLVTLGPFLPGNDNKRSFVSYATGGPSKISKTTL